MEPLGHTQTDNPTISWPGYPIQSSQKEQRYFCTFSA